MKDPRHMDRQKKREGQKQRDRYRDRDRDRPHAGTCTDRKREGQKQRDRYRDRDRCHAGPKAHGQTEKERDRNRGTDTGTETDVMQDPRHMDRQKKRGTDTGTETDRHHAGPKAHGQRDRGGQTQGQTSCRTQGRWTDKETEGDRNRYRDRDRWTNLVQDPRQRASQFQTLVDVEDQVSFIVETMLSLVVIVPDEQLVHLGQTSHVLDPIN